MCSISGKSFVSPQVTLFMEISAALSACCSQRHIIIISAVQIFSAGTALNIFFARRKVAKSCFYTFSSLLPRFADFPRVFRFFHGFSQFWHIFRGNQSCFFVRRFEINSFSAVTNCIDQRRILISAVEKLAPARRLELLIMRRKADTGAQLALISINKYRTGCKTLKNQISPQGTNLTHSRKNLFTKSTMLFQMHQRAKKKKIDLQKLAKSHTQKSVGRDADRLLN